MTRFKFKRKMGYKPQDDDLERVNCKLAGKIGHSLCGWCKIHDKPRFMCGCLVNAGDSADRGER